MLLKLTTEVHQRYQAAEYGDAALLLPRLITASDAMAEEAPADESRGRTTRVDRR